MGAGEGRKKGAQNREVKDSVLNSSSISGMQNFHSQSFNRENFLFQILRRSLTRSELTEPTSEYSEVRTKMFYVVFHIGPEYFSREYKTFYKTENKLLSKVLFRAFSKARFTDA